MWVTASRWSRALAIAVLAGGVGIMMVGNASAAASNATAKATTLRVTISGLPGGKTGDVAVTGPHFHKVLVKSTTFSKGLAAGSYVVTARSRAVGTGTYAAVIATQSVRIQRGRSMTVTVYYGDFVPRTTKAVSKAATLRLSGPATESRLLTVSAGEASQVQVGDVLASAATAAAPSGYLVQVTKIASSTSSSETLEVVPTTLAKAIPEGEMSIDTTLGASDVSQKLVDHLRLTRLSGRRHRYGTTYQNQYLTCTTSATFDVETPTLSIVPSISLHVKWGFFSLKSALFTASVFESINMGAHGDAGASCTTKDPGIALFSESVPLADFPVDIAGIPAEVSATIQVYLTGEAGVTGALDINVGETATPTVGVEYAGGHFSPIASGFTPTFTHSVSASASASASAFLVPTVALLVDGIAGPTFDVGGGVKLSADTAQDPWWELDGCIEAGVGFELDILGIHKSWEDQSLVSACKTILTATGGFSPPNSGPSYSVSLDSLCANSGISNSSVNGCPYDGTTSVGGQPFTYEAFVSDNWQSVYPSFWDLIDFPTNTCNAVTVTFGIPDGGGLPGDIAYLQVAGSSGVVAAQATYGTVGTLTTALNGEPWSLQNSATSDSDEIAINLTATCSTQSGF